MKKYEVMYIIHPTVEEQPRKALVEEINAVFTTNNSVVEKVNEWGMRDLAYEIAKTRKGYYVLMDVEATPEAIKEFERVANIKEAVIRHIVVAK